MFLFYNDCSSSFVKTALEGDENSCEDNKRVVGNPGGR